MITAIEGLTTKQRAAIQLVTDTAAECYREGSETAESLNGQMFADLVLSGLTDTQALTVIDQFWAECDD